MKKLIFVFPILIFCSILFLFGCSSNSKSDGAKMSDLRNTADSAKSEKSVAISSDSTKNDKKTAEKIDVPHQKVIYQADLQLRVKNFEKTVQNLEEKVNHFGGYIAESDVTKEGKEQLRGRMKIRIPQTNFQDFLHEAQGQATEVIQRNITGQDVTEEYVDLESRLKSKTVVAERLTSFMKSAEKTEDLLKISKDLASVQEEIETIEGRMKFLDNQTSLSTITITLYENKVIIPEIDNDKLNTWEKTKKQFMKSVNILLVALSDLTVFLFGNLPILIILLLFGLAIFLTIKKIRKGKHRE
ncbi:hypothetical protein BN000_00542 [Neobacillus massiliamazoniensis]|uniref:DUF4349 domain-containing protein n=2 Tax=Neobacillus massiliamazoniensis TaxID=1499688 RepID=A0A0U1NRL2_9BACI|nr:hypothetical protein BN000_00542 [Neobacillus massiliamazoniensis]